MVFQKEVFKKVKRKLQMMKKLLEGKKLISKGTLSHATVHMVSVLKFETTSTHGLQMRFRLSFA